MDKKKRKYAKLPWIENLRVICAFVPLLGGFLVPPFSQKAMTHGVLAFLALTFGASCSGVSKSQMAHELQPLIASLGGDGIEREKLISVCGLEGVESTVYPPGAVEPCSGNRYTGISEVWLLKDGFKLVGIHYFPKPRPEQYKSIDEWLAKKPMPAPPNFSHVQLLNPDGLIVRISQLL
ncbi:MAG: hypothetical protein IPK32_01375 [Verrucomicrobiaceae bacterium]|nr:hypothetical protein [Verrucomicrobiaceae bacterium]